MRIAIDLLWLKHKQIGGVESYIRNILDGLISLNDDFFVYLITTKDNNKSFELYCKDHRFEIVVCNTVASSSIRSIMWMNLHLDRLVKNLKVDICFVPNARIPFFTSPPNRYICTIHDLQALHYPSYFSRWRYLWLKYSIGHLVKKANRIIAISDFVKNDIVSKYNCNSEKITTIYNAIGPVKEFCDFNLLEKKYRIKKNRYFYTISSLLKHKNTITLLKMMDNLVNQLKRKDEMLLISGIRGDNYNSLSNYIKEKNLEKNCIFTGFVSDSERDTLIKNASFFLFPSIFEGFGMPVIEAMRMGTKCITTRCTSIGEISQGKAIYVDQPFDEKEWIQKIDSYSQMEGVEYKFEEYDRDVIAKKYLLIFENLIGQ